MFLVFDTSVLIAAFLTPQGLSAALLHLGGQKDGFLICMSHAILEELRIKLEEKDATGPEISIFLRLIRSKSVICDQTEYSLQEIREDDHILGCFKVCQADMVVTLDRKLLKRLKQREIPAVHPRNLMYYFPRD